MKSNAVTIMLENTREGGMVNIRTNGPESKAALEEHLGELDEEASPDDPVSNASQVDDLEAARKEIAWLRKEVADLRERLVVARAQTDDVAQDRADNHPWLRIVFVTGAWVLGKLVKRLRPGRTKPPLPFQ